MGYPVRKTGQPYLRNSYRDAAVRRVRDLLRAQVLAGEFDKTPLLSEEQLGRQFGVSRGIVRDSLDLLRRERLIVRLQGAGTFSVAPRRAAHGIDRLRKFTDEVERGTARTTWEVLNLEVLDAPPFLARKLTLPPGSPVIALERLLILDGTPLSLRASWFPMAVGAPLLDARPELHLLVYDLIEGLLGRQITKVALQIEPTVADAVTAPVLKVELGAPLQLIERVIYDHTGVPIEYGYGRIRGDRYVHKTVLDASRRCRQVHQSTPADPFADDYGVPSPVILPPGIGSLQQRQNDDAEYKLA